MLKSCQYCGKLHDIGFVCKRKPKKKFWKNTDRDAVRFRRSYVWVKTRKKILERDFNLCRVCNAGEYGSYKNDSLHVHHIVPLREDFDRRCDADNLLSLCQTHHAMAEDGAIKREVLERLASTPPRWSGDF